MKVLYRPKGRAQEYSPLAVNLYRGCPHRCKYCYAPLVLKKSAESLAMVSPRAGVLKDLHADLARFREHNTMAFGPVLMCFTCDPYPDIEKDLLVTKRAIELLKHYAFHFKILSKHPALALRDLHLYGPGDVFGTSLTLLDREDSRRWEPGADEPGDRIQALKEAYARGKNTWVSMEPVLDPEQSLELIRMTHPYVRHYSLGVINYDPIRKTIDWGKYLDDARALLYRHDKSFQVKRDLERAAQQTPKGHRNNDN